MTMEQGVTLAAHGDPWSAAEHFRALLARDPGDAAAHKNLAAMLMEQGPRHAAEARTHLEDALLLAPRWADAHFSLGLVMQQQGDHVSAMTHYQQALALDPAHAAAHASFTTLQQAICDWTHLEALWARSRHWLAGPDREAPYALTPLSVVARPSSAAEQHEAARRWVAASSAGAGPRVAQDQDGSTQRYEHTQHGDEEPRQEQPIQRRHALGCAQAAEPPPAQDQHKAQHRQTEQQDQDGQHPLPHGRSIAQRWRRALQIQIRAQPTGPLQPVAVQPRAAPGDRSARRRGNRLRLGYLSADFREHPVARQIVGVLEQHDRARVHVTGYSLGPDDDSALRGRIAAAVDEWVDVAPLAAREAARRIADEGTDVLVDLNGYTAGCRPAILAQCPAPCQVSFLGYPATTAAPFMDYVVTDRYLTPPAQQQHWSERFSYLPDCYMPPASGERRAATGVRDEGPTRHDVGLPERGQGFVFCCFNHTAKLTPQTFDVWMRLLQQTPGSMLWLFRAHPCAPTQLRREARARGVDAGRLVFAAHRAHEEYLALYPLADLFLDTWPYNGGATAHDALALGLPVLTLAGETYVGRMAGSQLRAVGLDELVTESPQEYERKALQLAHNPAWLGQIRARLAHNRGRAPLFDLARYTRNLEDAYEHMYGDVATCANSQQ